MGIRNRCIVTALIAMTFVLAACNRSAPTGDAAKNDQASATEPAPKPVNGWIELPLADDVFKVQSNPWRTDTIEIPVPAKGGELEYKLSINKGDVVVYTIDYGKLDSPDVIVSELHGHTAKRADGVGDLMFYSRTDGALQHGQLVAPWDGIHGWYLKNDSPNDVVVTLKMAGYYEIKGL